MANDNAPEKPRRFPTRKLLRESLIIFALLVLTAAMTWPWVWHLRDAARDEGDCYAHAYFLWWDYHQTFHDPLHLFDATIFYPYKDTLAFGENDYGISLVFFPLFALGLRPLTVYSVAAFLSFPFLGYGTFRLARTLSGENTIAWTAGIAIMFVPYRFQILSLLPLVFAGWIPLLLEALVRFASARTWTRSAWLGIAFVMNALTCLTWFVLTLLPLLLSGLMLISFYRLWRDHTFWRRVMATLGAACLVLLPFLLPFLRVARSHQFIRRVSEVQAYSAHWADWFSVDITNRLWHGLGMKGGDPEMVLFPGALLPLLAVLAVLPIAQTRVFRSLLTGEHSLAARLGALKHFELLSLGLLWCVIGFMGSFGQNLPFHRLLFQFVPLFRSMRVAARWAMICYLGLALLAGLGAWSCATLLSQRWPSVRRPVTVGVIILAILFEQRVAPFPIVRGEPDPDELTLYLKAKRMAGGIVELPAAVGSARFMLRAADHGHPLVTATDSFMPPLAQQIEALTTSPTIPDDLLTVLETIPASYVTVHNSLISPERRLALEDFLKRGTAQGRLRFIKSFSDRFRNGMWQRNDLYAVTGTEPAAQSEGPPPPPLSARTLEPLFSGLVARFQQTGFFIYRYYRASYGRNPRFAEFITDAKTLSYNSAAPPEDFEKSRRRFAESWVNKNDFRLQYDGLNDEQYVTMLLANTTLSKNIELHDRLLAGLRTGTLTRASVLHELVDNNAFAIRRFNEAFVLMHYFAYLERDPDEDGYSFWLGNLNRFTDYRSFTEAFAASVERQIKDQR